MPEKICAVCLWRGITEIGNNDCPHCQEEESLIYEEEYFELQNGIDNEADGTEDELDDIPELPQHNSDAPVYEIDETDDYETQD